MASANALGFLLPIGVGAAGVAGVSLLHIDLKTMATKFVTGPGRTSRILLALFVVANYKNMPFVWTVSAPPPFHSEDTPTDTTPLYPVRSTESGQPS